MLVIQDFTGFGQVNGFLGFDSPGDFQAHIQIAPHNSGFRRTKGLFGKTAKLLEQLILDFLSGVQFLNPLTIFIDIINLSIVTQFALDDFQFFPQIVLPLIAVHLLLGFLTEFLFDGQDVDFLLQKL